MLGTAVLVLVPSDLFLLVLWLPSGAGGFGVSIPTPGFSLVPQTARLGPPAFLCSVPPPFPLSPSLPLSLTLSFFHSACAKLTHKSFTVFLFPSPVPLLIWTQVPGRLSLRFGCKGILDSVQGGWYFTLRAAQKQPPGHTGWRGYLEAPTSLSPVQPWCQRYLCKYTSDHEFPL